MERITISQVTALLVVSRLTLTVVFFSAPLDVKQDVWWQSFPAALFFLPLVWAAERWLWRRFPDRTLPHVFEALLGKWPGRALTLAYATFFLFNFSLTLRLTAEFFGFAFLPTTPIVVIISVIAFLSAWAARAGLEVMGRAGQIVLPILTGSIVLIFVLLLKDLQTRFLVPLEILYTGPVPHLRDMLNVSTRTTEFLIVPMIYPHIREKQQLMRGVVRAQLLIGVLWVVVGVVVFGILGREVERYYFPFFTAARTISIADFLERVDAIFPAFWMFGMVLRGGLLLWCAATGAAQGLRLAGYRPYVVGLAGFGVTLAVVQAESLAELQTFLVPEILTPFLLLFTWIIPLLLIPVATVRRQ